MCIINKFIYLLSITLTCILLSRETNLKVKQCLPDVASIEDNIEAISNFDGSVRCEPPNNNLNCYQGTLEWRDKKWVGVWSGACISHTLTFNSIVFVIWVFVGSVGFEVAMTRYKNSTLWQLVSVTSLFFFGNILFRSFQVLFFVTTT